MLSKYDMANSYGQFLSGSVSLTYWNLSPLALYIGPRQASKDDRFDEALYMEYAQSYVWEDDGSLFSNNLQLTQFNWTYYQIF